MQMPGLLKIASILRTTESPNPKPRYRRKRNPYPPLYPNPHFAGLQQVPALPDQKQSRL